MIRASVILCLCLLMAGCAGRHALDFLPGAGAPGAQIRPVFVASNRSPAPRTMGLFAQDFGGTRRPTLRYARLDVSIPPVHETGRIEWPRADLPDPARHFVVTGETEFAGRGAFLDALPGAPGDEVVLFVHGFNVDNAEAVYRLAQIAHDYDAEQPVIAFSWPSAGNPRGYAYDRDSVVYSRDMLEALLVALSARREVLIVAHSMGSQLTMETLRQMAIGDDGAVLRRLSGVALISPDIDEEVFRRQASRIVPFPQPFLIAVSARDRVLNLAALLTGKPSRLGSIDDPARLSGLPVRVVDLTGVAGGDRGGHLTAFTAPAAIRLLRGLANAVVD